MTAILRALGVVAALLLTVASTSAAQGKITISPTTATIVAGTKKQLSRTVTVVWSSSDTTIASVTQTGWVTAKKPGVVTISVSVGSLVAKSTITVTPAPVVTTGTRDIYAYIARVKTYQFTVYDTTITVPCGAKCTQTTSWSCPVFPVGSKFGPPPPLCTGVSQ